MTFEYRTKAADHTIAITQAGCDTFDNYVARTSAPRTFPVVAREVRQPPVRKSVIRHSSDTDPSPQLDLDAGALESVGCGPLERIPYSELIEIARHGACLALFQAPTAPSAL